MTQSRSNMWLQRGLDLAAVSSLSLHNIFSAYHMKMGNLLQITEG